MPASIEGSVIATAAGAVKCSRCAHWPVLLLVVVMEAGALKLLLDDIAARGTISGHLIVVKFD